MASTLSAKSQQPLHNFPLPELKWAINNPTSSNHQFRSRNKLAEKSDDELDYPLRDHSPDDRSPVMKSAASDCSIERSLSMEKLKSAANEEKAKILLRIRTKSKSPDDVGEEEAGGGQIKVASAAAAATAAAAGGEAEEPAPKIWNLRPRKPASKPFFDGGSLRIGAAPPQEMKTQMPGRHEFSRSRAVAAEAKTAEKKQKFSITLSKEEIEEDIFVLTGSKPARRPKKRARIIQKQLDHLFPGLWLASINPDSYRVPDTPAKVMV
ncbi:hypothetical protein UlMin_021265 [Ulmus minor]